MGQSPFLAQSVLIESKPPVLSVVVSVLAFNGTGRRKKNARGQPKKMPLMIWNISSDPDVLQHHRLSDSMQWIRHCYSIDSERCWMQSTPFFFPSFFLFFFPLFSSPGARGCLKFQNGRRFFFFFFAHHRKCVFHFLFNGTPALPICPLTFSAKSLAKWQCGTHRTHTHMLHARFYSMATASGFNQSSDCNLFTHSCDIGYMYCRGQNLCFWITLYY